MHQQALNISSVAKQSPTGKYCHLAVAVTKHTINRAKQEGAAARPHSIHPREGHWKHQVDGPSPSIKDMERAPQKPPEAFDPVLAAEGTDSGRERRLYSYSVPHNGTMGTRRSDGGSRSSVSDPCPSPYNATSPTTPSRQASFELPLNRPIFRIGWYRTEYAKLLPKRRPMGLFLRLEGAYFPLAPLLLHLGSDVARCHSTKLQSLVNRLGFLFHFFC